MGRVAQLFILGMALTTLPALAQEPAPLEGKNPTPGEALHRLVRFIHVNLAIAGKGIRLTVQDKRHCVVEALVLYGIPVAQRLRRHPPTADDELVSAIVAGLDVNNERRIVTEIRLYLDGVDEPRIRQGKTQLAE